MAATTPASVGDSATDRTGPDTVARREATKGQLEHPMSENWFVRSLRQRTGLLQWLMLFGAAGFVAWILMSRGDELRSAFDLTPQLFALITLSCFGTFALNGIELQVLARRFERHVPIKEALALGLMIQTLNYLPMKTGTVLNGVVMRARYRLPLSDFMALVAGSNFVHLWVALALAGISLLAGGGTELRWGLLLFGGPTLVLAALIAWGRIRTAGRFSEHSSKIVRVAWRVIDGVGLILGDWRLLFTDLAINIGLVLLWAVRAYWSFQALGVHASFAAVLTMSGLGIFVGRLSVIPGGVGFREAGAAFGSSITGVKAATGMAASVIDRAVMLLWLLVIGLPVTLWMLRLTGVKLESAFAPQSTAADEDASEPAEV